MQNDFTKQWVELNELAIASFRDMATNNIQAMEQMLTSFVNPGSLAEVTKSSIGILKELGEVYSDSVNQLFKTQLKLVNLHTTSEMSKELGDIYVSSMTNLGKKQAELMHLYIDTMANYLETLKDAKKPDDLIIVQASMFTELQEKVKTNMIETMGVFNTINSAMEIWTQNSLDKMANGDS